MKKINKIIVVVCSIIMFLILMFINIEASPIKGDIHFGVLSDTHLMDDKSLQDDKFETALEILKKKSNGKLDAVVIAGDVTDNGEIKSYDKVNKIYNSILGDSCQRLFVMGNHDYYNKLNPKEAQKRFCEKTMMNLDERKVIKGYNFILVNTLDSSLEGTFDDNTLENLKKNIEAAEGEGNNKPIFVIVHQPIKDTVLGSTRKCTDKLGEVLKDYPNVICISGHSHCPINDERSIYQKDYTCINVGGMKRIGLEDTAINIKDIKKTEFSMGLLIDVKGSKVTVTRIDFMNNREFKNKWVIDTAVNKDQFKYTAARKLERKCPHFNDKAKIDIVSVGKDNIKLKFSKANHDDFVYCYYIILEDEDNDKVEGEFKIVTDFYNINPSNSYTIELSNLVKQKHYKVTIKAVESFGNCSDNHLWCDFTI